MAKGEKRRRHARRAGLKQSEGNPREAGPVVEATVLWPRGRQVPRHPMQDEIRFRVELNGRRVTR